MERKLEQPTLEHNNRYAPTTIQAFNLPRGATFGSCTSSGDETTCTFSWTPQSGDAGDHLVCFAGDDTDSSNTLLNPISSCQSIRIIDSADLLKLSLPTYSETGILKCANKQGFDHCDSEYYDSSKADTRSDVMSRSIEFGIHSSLGQ